MTMQAIADEANAREYLVEQLAEGTTLATLALERLDLSLGRFWAGVPIGIDQAAINFHHSMRGLEKEDEEFARILKRFIEQEDGRALVADTERRSSQNTLEGYPYEHCRVTYGDEVYWRIGPSLSETDMLNLFGAPLLPYPLLIFLYLVVASLK